MRLIFPAGPFLPGESLLSSQADALLLNEHATVGQMLVVKRHHHRNTKLESSSQTQLVAKKLLMKERNSLLAPSHASQLPIHLDWDCFI